MDSAHRYPSADHRGGEFRVLLSFLPSRPFVNITIRSRGLRSRDAPFGERLKWACARVRDPGLFPLLRFAARMIPLTRLRSVFRSL